MSKTTKIQVPLNKSLRTRAEETAKSYGYSSLQEVIRVFLTGFINKRIHPSFVSDEVEILTPEEDSRLVKLALEAYNDIKKGDIYTATSGEELVEHAKSIK